MKLKCPECGSIIRSSNINIECDTANCVHCDDVYRVTDLIETSDQDLPENAPVGAWLRNEGGITIIGASTKSKAAIYLIPVTLALSIVIADQMLEKLVLSRRADLFGILFFLPFIIGCACLGWYSLMSAFGKIELRIGEKTNIFVGFGAVGWNRAFLTRDYENTYEDDTERNSYPGAGYRILIISAHKEYRLAPGVSKERHKFLINAIRREFAKKRVKS